jgi:hypothetical protein
MKLQVYSVVCLFVSNSHPLFSPLKKPNLHENILCTPIYSRSIKIYKTVIYLVFMDVNLFPHIKGLLQNGPKEDI